MKRTALNLLIILALSGLLLRVHVLTVENAVLKTKLGFLWAMLGG